MSPSCVVCSAGETFPKEEILFVPCDVLVPAAIGNVITSETAPKIEAKFVVEAANGPTTPQVGPSHKPLRSWSCQLHVNLNSGMTGSAAVCHLGKHLILPDAINIPLLQGDLILRDRNITVLPDIYTNAGGVTVSFYEWSATQPAVTHVCP